MEVFCKKRVLKNFAKFTGKRLCQGLFLTKLHMQACNFIKILAQMFSCEFCEIFKNTFFYRTHQVAASFIPFLLNTSHFLDQKLILENT